MSGIVGFSICFCCFFCFSKGCSSGLKESEDDLDGFFILVELAGLSGVPLSLVILLARARARFSPNCFASLADIDPLGTGVVNSSLTSLRQ